MRRLAGFAAGILLGVVVIACADAGAQGGDVGERIETPGDFDDVYTFCSHNVRVFVTETDAQSSSAIAVSVGNGHVDSVGC
jgi:hypothetical protein